MHNTIMDVTNNSVDTSGKLSHPIIHPDVYSITHDLRAPLMSIKGLICLMKADTTKANLDEYLSFLEDSVNKMNESISQIIDQSKDDTTPRQSSQEIDFKKVINESLLSLRYMEDIEFVHTTISVQESGLFLSDSKRILSIINNMISNAVRYRDQDKKSFLHIDVSFNNGKAHLVFTDNGIGISEESQSKIFNKLFRVSNDHRGSGLGLNIVRESIKKLRGEIKVNSTLGKGTTFTIEIPNQLSSSLSMHCD